MPKGLNLKSFGRRKSSGNALDFDEPSAAPAQSSFRVLERPGKSSTYNAQSGRTFNSPLNTLRGKSVDNLGLGPNRGSGGTTNSGSSGYYDSSSGSLRHSSSSTLPSSVDQERVDEDELYPVRKSLTAGMYKTVPPSADVPAPPTSFTTRAARALSFGQKHGKSSKDIPPVPPPHIPAASQGIYPQRERAMTASSYASTAVPPKTELNFSSDFGADFGDMFASLKKEIPLHPPRVESAGAVHRTDSEPMFPPRTLSRNALTPSPRHEVESPYNSDDRGSNEGLFSTLSSPNTIDGNTPTLAVGNGIAQAFLGASKSGYSRVPERSPGPERSGSIDSYNSVTDEDKPKEPEYPNRQTQVDDEDRWVRRVELSDAPMPSPVPPKAIPASTNGSLRQQTPMSSSSGFSQRGAASSISSGGDSILAESNSTTPRAVRENAKSLSSSAHFDSSPAGPPSRAIRPLTHHRAESGGLKRMTKAQFKALQSRGEDDSQESEEEDLSADDYDAEDDIERAKQMATQRRKQEANMSVYRQQMKKVTGGGPTDLPGSGASTMRPSMDRGASAPAATGGGGIHLGGIGGQPPADTTRGKADDDEDDDVPLGILQAHGFPSGSRPPTRLGENDINNQRRNSTAGSVVGGGAGQGNLPPFARRLPADPYFGAGLVNQQTRESLAMNSSGASVVGIPTGAMQPPMPQAGAMAHPGGLVGVIAGEERARAARRGSPNAAVMSGAGMPLPPNMPPTIQQSGRTMSMGNLAPPSIYNGAPPMPQMPLMPQMGMMGMPQIPQQSMMDPAGNAQLQQFMAMQMQLMQNMLSMQQAQMGQTGPQTPQAQPHQPGDYLGVNFGNGSQRPMSIASQASFQQGPSLPNQGRSMTMMNPPTGWGLAPQPNGQRPNSAMPMAQGHYAPSVAGLNLSSGGPGPGYTPSIAPSERSNIGMPSRYRPVTQNGDSSRTQSMSSSLTLNAFASQQTAPSPGTPFNASQAQTPKSTIRIVDKPKGAPRTSMRAGDEDEDDGWANMRKKREEKKKFKWGRKDKTASTVEEPSLTELYPAGMN